MCLKSFKINYIMGCYNLLVKVSNHHEFLARSQVADGGTASDMAGEVVWLSVLPEGGRGLACCILGVVVKLTNPPPPPHEGLGLSVPASTT
jgi:hypothetical protein